MNKSYLLLITVFLLHCLSVSSQTYNKPSKISNADFNNIKQHTPTVLFYRTLVTFPYSEEYGEAGALDKFFGLELKSFLRIAFSKSDSCQRIIVFPKIYDQEPKVKSIKCYYKKDNSIAIRKINDSDLILSSDAFAHYIDFSKLIKDSLVIFDVDLSNSSNKPYYKQKLLMYLDKNILYKDFGAQIYIPEIYFYEKNVPETCFSLNVKTNILGPRIGYKSTTGNTETITPKVLVDMFSEKFGSKFEQVYCRLTLLTLNYNKSCNGFINSTCTEIINYNLTKIIEKK